MTEELCDRIATKEDVEQLSEDKYEIDASIQREDTASGLCGCGKPGRYMLAGSSGTFSDAVMACNKYQRCPSYNELVEKDKKQTNESTACL